MMHTPDNAPGRRAEASSQLRVIVLGYIVRGPLGGLAWHHLQYVMGLRLLGYDVYFVEDSNDYPACYDPVRNVTDENPDFGLKWGWRTAGRTTMLIRRDGSAQAPIPSLMFAPRQISCWTFPPWIPCAHG